ncbi:MAG: ammonium transporter [Planctomycetales bacterium]|nr:ammonium transporter [Planctomycetales bacterium]
MTTQRFNSRSLLSKFAPLALLAATTTGAFAQEGGAAAASDTGNNAWMLTSTALVLFMTIPGLALFYGGLVNKRNVLSVLMHCFSLAAVLSLVWMILGYSLAVGAGGGLTGGLGAIFHKGIGPDKILGSAFQMTFFIITPALIVGTFVERIKFSALLIFSVLWALLVYAPICHITWFGGVFQKWGVVDLAGGIVVHITAGVAALIACLMVGKRRHPEPPHNLPMTVTGTAMLWVGWFGFNAGSELASDDLTSSAFAATHFSAAAGAVAWAAIEWLLRGKPSVLGAASGAVAGLVCVTPAAGFVNPVSAMLMGVSGGVVCFFACTTIKSKFGYDDSLDAFGVHGVGGTLGAILTGVFATRACWNIDGSNPLGLIEGRTSVFVGQIVATGITWVYAAVVTFILLKILDATMGLRVRQDVEIQGLDIKEHGEEGYIFF